VDEKFYLAFPIAVALLGLRSSAAKILVALAAVVVLGMALRGWLWLHDVAQTPFDLTAQVRTADYIHLISYPTWARLDGLLAGIAAALLLTLAQLPAERVERVGRPAEPCAGGRASGRRKRDLAFW
jgi:hypothetical protein